ncbi:MAG: hypothetical protein WKG00_26305 [Polyangiaceae bacterium]
MTRPTPLLFLLSIALAFGATAAHAEDVSPGEAVAAGARPVVPASVSVATPQPSVAARARDASSKLRAVEAQTFRVQAELRTARRGKDAVRVGCLDALLTRLHVARARRPRAGRGHRRRPQGRRPGAEEREVVRLVYLADRADRLYHAAGLCRTRTVVVVQGPNGTQVRASAPELPDAAGYPPPAPPRTVAGRAPDPKNALRCRGVASAAGVAIFPPESWVRSSSSWVPASWPSFPSRSG